METMTAIKASKFNLFFLHEGYQVGYNSYSDQFIMLEDMLYQMYDASFKKADFEELLEVHPEFHEHLYRNGFLIDSEIDEIERVKKASYAIDNDDSLFQLHINPTMNCNFKCWYCYETHIKDSKMDEPTIAKTESYIANIIGNNSNLKEFSLSWFGGEPLLYFHKVMVPILKSTYELTKPTNINFHSSMTTNGLLIDQKMIDICKQYNLNFFQITLDGDRERHDQVRFISEGRGSYDKIVANIILLAENRMNVNVRVNISPETLPGLNFIVNDFFGLDPMYHQHILFDFHKVWQVEGDIDDQINDSRTYFRSKGFKVSTGTHDTLVNSCYGDRRNHATINYNGEAFKCTARDFTTANSEGILIDGEIQWGEKYERRLQSKFKNKPCLECPILPLCGGGCSQHALENEGKDYCVHNFDMSKKISLVRNKFIDILN